MHLVQHSDAPTAETVLFHLTLFGEFCETQGVDDMSLALAFECLRDAVDALRRSADDAPFSAEASAAIESALEQSQATFREDMPDHFARTNASRGFSALRDLVRVPVESDWCSERERRSTAMANAERFGKTLSAFLVALQTNAARRRRGTQRSRRTEARALSA